MVLIPLRTQAPSQFFPSIFFLNSSGHLTRVTFALSAYPISIDRLTRILPEHLTQTPPERLTRLVQCLPSLIRSYPAELSYPILLLIGLLLTQSYTVLPGRITLPDMFPIGLLPTRLYPTILPDFLTRPSNTSLHPTAYPALPNHLTRMGTLQLASLKTSSSASHPDIGLLLADNVSR
jgi:hypothetical protein